jgi:site-specific DNA recombinase
METKMIKATTETTRCAVYTRKSTDEGLEQAFNSLDAQREAAEAYIASQRGEGWSCISDRYDDGGYTGGNMERPALKRLLSDIETGKVDCVLVYKVDRLSRSLLDFSRIISLFDSHNVSFVSVTQQFNTTTSMGRLTLNILLSFAQFEREIISERTRDKIAATRKKGKWTGGIPILGYDIDPNAKRLVVNEDEAARIRTIFEYYLEKESLVETIKAIDKHGWRTKAWTTKKGKHAGGKLFTKNNLFRLLTNILYTGKITHKDNVYEGEQPAIIDEDIFSRVQKMLKRNGATGGKLVRNKYGALLKGLLYCKSCGTAMSHSYSMKQKSKRYRYYVCQAAQKRGWHTCPTKSVPAEEIERFVVEQIRAVGKDKKLQNEIFRQANFQNRERLKGLEAEKKALEREVQRHSSEIKKLVSDLPTDCHAADHLADLRERIRTAEQRATVVRDELLVISRQLFDEREIAKTMSLFDPVWDNLTSKEQARVIQILVKQISYDGVNHKVSVTFHPAGIKTLAQDFAGDKR